uniref:Uncharacterized protein n=1 Tax=Oryzias latipes TaxID=8090 RepID=A0A3P9LNT2_ORYLA
MKLNPFVTSSHCKAAFTPNVIHASNSSRIRADKFLYSDAWQICKYNGKSMATGKYDQIGNEGEYAIGCVQREKADGTTDHVSILRNKEAITRLKLIKDRRKILEDKIKSHTEEMQE